MKRSLRHGASIVAITTVTLFTPITALALSPATPIDSSQPFYLFSKIPISVSPEFTGGTLKLNSTLVSVSYDFSADDSLTNIFELDGNIIDTAGWKNYSSGTGGKISFIDSVGGGALGIWGNVGSVTDRFGTIENNVNLTFHSSAIVFASRIENNGSMSVFEGATIDDDLFNNAVFSNAGTYNAVLHNQGGGADLTNEASGVWNGDVLDNSGGAVITNDGTWNGNLSNNSIVTNNSVWNGDVSNNIFGLLDNYGSINGYVANRTFTSLNNFGSITGYFTNDPGGSFTNSGTIDNDGSVSISYNGGGITNNSGATINSDIENSYIGNIVNEGTWNGIATNFGNFDNKGSFTGTVYNSHFVLGSGNFTNSGTVTGSLVNTGDETKNELGGVWNGTIVENSGGALITNDGTWNSGSDLNNAGSSIINNGTWNGYSIVNHGSLSNTGTWNGAFHSYAGGDVTNDGTWNGRFGNNGGSNFTNNGTFNNDNFYLSTNNGTLTNSATGIMNTTFYNDVGGVAVNDGIWNLDNGFWSGGRLDNFGNFTNNGTLVGDVNNTFNFLGTGTFTNTGTIRGHFYNNATAYLTGIIDGDLDNNAVTLDINGNLQVTGLISNVSGGTLNVTAFGNLTAGGIDNAAGATINVDTGGVVDDDLNNSGIVNNSGTYTADVNNSGAAAYLTNNGTWNGDLLTNISDATVDNKGTWTGDAFNSAKLYNSGTWTGDITNKLNGVVSNTGTINGDAFNDGIFDLGGGTINGDFTNQGTGYFLVSSDALLDGDLFNNDDADFRVGGLHTFSLVNFTNNSSVEAGIYGALNASGDVNNDAGELKVYSGGYLNAKNVNNALLGSITNDGTVFADLFSSGIVNNNGSWNGDVTNIAFGDITNYGTINGAIHNELLGQITNNGIIFSDGSKGVSSNDFIFTNNAIGNVTLEINNSLTGIIDNLGTWTGDVSNFGEINNVGTWNGVINLDQGGIVNNDGDWIGNAFSVVGEINNNGNWTGTFSIEALSTLNNFGTWYSTGSSYTSGLVNNESGAVMTADLLVDSLGEFYNAGAFSGNLRNFGLVTNDTGGFSNASIINWEGGDVLNDGTWTASVNNRSTLRNNGTWTGNLTNYAVGNLSNHGTWNGASFNYGTLNNFATWNGNATVGNLAITTNRANWNGNFAVQSGGKLINSGTWVGGASGTDGIVINNVGANMTADVSVNPGGLLQNRGTWNGEVNSWATVTNYEGAVWNGLLNNIDNAIARNYGTWNGSIYNLGASTLNNTGIISGGILYNEGTARLSGTVTNTIHNAADGLIVTMGDVLGGGSIETSGNSSLQIRVGHTWSNVMSITNGATNSEGIQVLGTLNVNGGVINQNGATLHVFGGGRMVAGSVTNRSGGMIKIDQGGQVNDDLNNFGSVLNNGTYNANVNNSGSAASIINNGAWSGNLLSNTSDGLISNAGTWNGFALNNAILQNGGIWNGNVSNLSAGILANTGTINGNISNSGIATNDTTGIINGTFNNSGTFTNSGLIDSDTATSSNFGDFLNLGIINANILNDLTGTLTNDSGGAIVGEITNTIDATIDNSGSMVLDLLTNSGLVMNTGDILAKFDNAASGLIDNTGTFTDVSIDGSVNAGLLNNMGEWNGFFLNNSGEIFNGTEMNIAALTNSGTILNGLDGTFTSNIDNSGWVVNNGIWDGVVNNLTNGTFTNEGTINGDFDNTGLAEIAGTLNGDVTNNVGGTFFFAGTLNGLITNRGDFGASGTINGAISNLGTGNFFVAGDLSSNGTFTNDETAKLAVASGANFINLTGLVNKSTLADSVVILGNLTTSGEVDNRAGATIHVGNGGKLTAGSLKNAADGKIFVDEGGTIIDDLSNSGTVSNSGTYTADVNNTGSSALLRNELTGVWNGDVNSNDAGASLLNLGVWNGNLVANTNSSIVQNSGTWNGDATNDADLVNMSGATWVGNATNNANGIMENYGTWTGAITNSGSFYNDGTGVISGLVTNNLNFTNAGTINGGANNAAGTLANSGTINGGATVTGGVLNTSGTINGGLDNTAGVFASGAINGATVNHGAGELTVTGNLAANSTLTNADTAYLLVSGGDLTGITDLANSSSRSIGIGISAGRLLSVNSLSNAAGSVIVNLGTLTSASPIANNGRFESTGIVNGGANNAAGGTIVASGQFNGNIANSGTFALVGGLSNNGGTFNNAASGILSVGGNSFTGLGAITNAAGGQIGVGTSTANGTLSATSLTNSGAVHMMNARIGDTINLTGAYSGVSGSVLSFDVNTTTLSADRINAASHSGTSSISLQNLGTSKLYFESPIVLINASSGSGTFTAANDAQTNAALASNGLIDYKITNISGTSNWGLVSSLNNAKAASLNSDLGGFATTLGNNITPDIAGISKGHIPDKKISGMLWARFGSGSNEFENASSNTSAYSSKTNSTTEMDSTNIQIGHNWHFNQSETNKFDLGIVAGQNKAETMNSASGLRTDITMPYFGVYGATCIKGFNLSAQAYSLKPKADADNSITTDETEASGTLIKASASYEKAYGKHIIEGFGSYSIANLGFDPITLNGGVGSIKFDDIKSQLASIGVKYSTNIDKTNAVFTPFGSLAFVNESGSDANSVFDPTGVANDVKITSDRVGSFTKLSVGLNMKLKSNGLEIFSQADLDQGSQIKGSAIQFGARMKF